MSQEPYGQEQRVVNEDGKPFETERHAVVSAGKVGYKRDQIDVLPHESGGFYYIAKKEAMPNPERIIGHPKPDPTGMRYFRVKFSPKTNENEPDNIVLSVNGEPLHIQRSQEVVIPENYLITADHACYPQYRQVPGEDRKIVGWVSKAPREVIGESNRQEFLAMFEAGTRRVRAQQQEYAPGANPPHGV